MQSDSIQLDRARTNFDWRSLPCARGEKPISFRPIYPQSRGTQRSGHHIRPCISSQGRTPLMSIPPSVGSEITCTSKLDHNAQIELHWVSELRGSRCGEGFLWELGPSVNRIQLIGGDVWQGSFCKSQGAVRRHTIELHLFSLGNGNGKVHCRTLLEFPGTGWLGGKKPRCRLIFHC